jgi:hypothetical protein
MFDFSCLRSDSVVGDHLLAKRSKVPVIAYLVAVKVRTKDPGAILLDSNKPPRFHSVRARPTRSAHGLLAPARCGTGAHIQPVGGTARVGVDQLENEEILLGDAHVALFALPYSVSITQA